MYLLILCENSDDGLCYCYSSHSIPVVEYEDLDMVSDEKVFFYRRRTFV